MALNQTDTNTSLISDHQTPAELLPIFYANNNLGMDGGQNSSVVKMDIMKSVHFYIPNFDARRKAVLWHDIHHLVTGYSAANFLGECEISAWEIASGCRNYWAAFLINTSGVALGCLINPRKIIQAYARGRRTRNFYKDLYPVEKVMHTSVSELRSWLLLDINPKETIANFGAIMSLLGFLLFALMYSLLMIFSLPILLLYNLWVLIWMRSKK
ncbi:MAG: hypothetical protein M3R25_00285 [Bacteroidota bacterium]|nr:hypothetical protein [Bacteroidota bacterium]